MNRQPFPERPARKAGRPGPLYGLTARETRAEARRLAAYGFQLWELQRLFGHPRTWGRPWT